ncbi:MAG: aminotransferase class I/II-fold pyridoxal phosphate-dependent enzyme [Thermoproteota archaeon]|jgi:Aspartate/tyrosine/aromatic aminotransferase
MVELFDWEEQNCDINLSISGIEPLENIEGLPKNDREPEEILADWYKVEKENVVITHGAQESLFLVYLALKPEHVCIYLPAYPPFFEQAELLGIKFSFINKDEYLNGKFIVLSNPNNPLGYQLDLSEIVKSNLVVSDEIFKFFVSDEIFFHDNLIIISGTSKFFNIKERKVGWIIANKNIVNRVKKIKDLVTPEPLYDKVLIKFVFNNYNFFKERNKKICERNYAIIENSQLKNYFEIIYTKHMPVAALEKENLDSYEYCKKLLEKERVLLTPLSFFKFQNGIRIYLGYEKPEYLKEAIARIEKFNLNYF